MGIGIVKKTEAEEPHHGNTGIGQKMRQTPMGFTCAEMIFQGTDHQDKPEDETHQKKDLPGPTQL